MRKYVLVVLISAALGVAATLYFTRGDGEVSRDLQETGRELDEVEKGLSGSTAEAHIIDADSREAQARIDTAEGRLRRGTEESGEIEGGIVRLEKSLDDIGDISVRIEQTFDAIQELIDEGARLSEEAGA